MKATAVAAFALAVCCSGVQARAGLHPVEKVIAMLKGLSAKAEVEGKKEALTFEKFEYWCKNSFSTLSKAIAEETETIDMLKSEIEAKTKQEASLTEEIAALGASIEALKASGVQAQDARKATADLYASASKDFDSTIAAIKEAIAELEGSKKPALMLLSQPAIRNAIALAKVYATSEDQRQELSALLQTAQRPGDYESHIKTYNFKSNNVIELLKGLQIKFEDEKLAATQAETNSLNQYELEKQARNTEISASQASSDEKTSILSAVKEELAEHKGDLKNTEEDLGADTKSKDETEKACAVKAREWEERSKVRAQELEAMAAAIEILAKATGVRTEPPSNPVPPPSPVDSEGSLLSVHSHSFLQIAEDPRTKAIKLLRAAARVTHSKALERLAEEMNLSKGSPFDKVINMIEKMIFHLMDEQKDEDVHKLWCDEELSKTNTSQVHKEDKIAELSTEIEVDTSTVQKLTFDIEAAQKMVADITAFMAEATEIRKMGKAENEQALKDAQDAQTAIADATAVLEVFYKESGMVEKQPYELAQRDPVELPETPATWGSSYTGVADPLGQPAGIITVLKKTGSEFATMEADTRAQEEIDQKAYDEEMKNSEIEKVRRAKEVEMKAEEKKRLVDKIGELTKSKKHFSSELEAVEQYLKDLRPACVDGDSTYEDRKAARAKEIEALKEAQVIVQDAFKEPAPGPSLMAVPVKAAGFLRAH